MSNMSELAAKLLDLTGDRVRSENYPLSPEFQDTLPAGRPLDEIAADYEDTLRELVRKVATPRVPSLRPES